MASHWTKGERRSSMGRMWPRFSWYHSTASMVTTPQNRMAKSLPASPRVSKVPLYKSGRLGWRKVSLTIHTAVRKRGARVM